MSQFNLDDYGVVEEALDFIQNRISAAQHNWKDHVQRPFTKDYEKALENYKSYHKDQDKINAIRSELVATVPE